MRVLVMKLLVIKIQKLKPRNLITKDLFTPKYRLKVVPNKKRISKFTSLIIEEKC